MAINVFDIPLLNPLKPIRLGGILPSNSANDYLYTYNPSFNNKHIDDDFYVKGLRWYEDTKPYLQPFQQSDTIIVQWTSEDLTASNFAARLLSANGSTYTLKTVTVVDQATYGSSELYYVAVKLYDVPEGVYFLELRNGASTTWHNVIHEPIHIKQIHPKTIRFDYYNTSNDQSMLYPSTSMYPIQLRVRGILTEIDADADFNVYKDQPLNAEMVSGVPYRSYVLEIENVPEWMIDKINRILLCDVLKIDGKKFTRQSGAKLEVKRVAGVPTSSFTVKLWDRENLDTLVLTDNVKVLGSMPQTNYFWVESISLNGTTNIRKGFKGKRNFLDYLNSTLLTTYGYFAEDANSQLVVRMYEDYSFVGTWSLDAANVLLYGIKLVVTGGGGALELTISKGAIVGTTNYAQQNGDGIGGTNLTSFGTPTLSKTYSTTGVYEHFLYFSDLESVSIAVTNNIIIKSIGGDLAPSFKSLSINNVGDGLEQMENNMFRYVTAGFITTLTFANQAFGTYQIDEVLRFIYDGLTKFNASAVVTLTQGTAAPSSNTMGNIKSVIRASITTLTTD